MTKNHGRNKAAHNKIFGAVGMPAVSATVQPSYQHPNWMGKFIESTKDLVLRTPEQMMAVAIELSKQNVLENTGGPFGAVIVNARTGQIAGWGTNAVTRLNSSLWHGEMVAILDAQTRLAKFNLGEAGQDGYILATSAAPCAMCTGGTVWSGVKAVYMGATSADVERITGFDEGPIHPQIMKELEKRGIQVVQEVEREAACAVLQLYVDRGGFIYNGGSWDSKATLPTPN